MLDQIESNLGLNPFLKNLVSIAPFSRKFDEGSFCFSWHLSPTSRELVNRLSFIFNRWFILCFHILFDPFFHGGSSNTITFWKLDKWTFVVFSNDRRVTPFGRELTFLLSIIFQVLDDPIIEGLFTPSIISWELDYRSNSICWFLAPMRREFGVGVSLILDWSCRISGICVIFWWFRSRHFSFSGLIE